MTREVHGARDASSEAAPSAPLAGRAKKATRLVADNDGMPTLQVSAGAVIVASLVVAVAALASTVVVASVTDAETLSTVALALAVVAFVVQIVVFVAQAGASQAQRVRAEQLNAETSTVLAEVKTTAASTQQLIQEQFREVLQAVLGGAARTAEETKLDPDRLEERLLDNIRAQVLPEAQQVAQQRGRAMEPSARRRAVARPSAPRTSPAGNPRAQVLRAFPDEQSGRRALEQLRALPGVAQYRLKELGEDVISSAQNRIFEGLQYSSADRPLLDAGLATRARIRDPSDDLIDVVRLTDAGCEIARLLTAEGELPPWLDLGDVQTEDDIPF